jgi:molecular chaperone IbpA|tara:strand:- start:324 stop:725 length:402 start_codon:yes stop_codon:yes gene_type:complete
MTIDISKFWLGMNNDMLLHNTETSYPRYNIVENVANGTFRLEVALPGWSKNEIELVHEDNELLLKGKKERKLGEDERFSHQGLSLKSFERKFRLNADLKVDSVLLADGLLTIALSKTPNSNRKVLEINSEKST